jgi:hypothetical protein
MKQAIQDLETSNPHFLSSLCNYGREIQASVLPKANSKALTLAKHLLNLYGIKNPKSVAVELLASITLP